MMTKGEHTNERTYVRTTYVRTGQTRYPLHNFVVRGDNKLILICCSHVTKGIFSHDAIPH